MVGTLIIAGLLIAAGIIFPSASLPVWGLALCFLAWGLKDVIPYPKSYDSDYVERYLAAQEEARIKTRAYLRQAHLHREEIARLNKMIHKD